MAGEAPTETTPATESVGLQAQLDQLEAAILEAHRHIDKSAPRDGAEDQQVDAPGAEATAARCIDAMTNLNTRLDGLVGRVGHL